MGLIELYKIKYDRINTGEETWEWEKNILNNGLIPSMTFINTLKFKKSRDAFVCVICSKDKPINTRKLGDSYSKICSDCAKEWFSNSIKEMQNIINKINESKKDLEKNEKKWKKEMILGALSEDEKTNN